MSSEQTAETAAAPSPSDIPPDSSSNHHPTEGSAAAASPTPAIAVTQDRQAYIGHAFPHFPSEQASRPAPPDAHASYAPSSGMYTPSNEPATPALSSHAYESSSSVPGTPSEYAGSATHFVPNPALALGTPLRELGHLSLAGSPDLGSSSELGGGGSGLSNPSSSRDRAGGDVTGVGADVNHVHANGDAAAAAPTAGGKYHPPSSAAVEQVLARTSAGQQALRDGSLPHPKNLAIPMPGPAAGTTLPGDGPGSVSSSNAAGGGASSSSNVATPGSTRAGTPAATEGSMLPPPSSAAAVQSEKEGATAGSAPKRPTNNNGAIDGAGGAGVRTMSSATTSSSTEAARTSAAAAPLPTPAAAPAKEGKKSVFGKLFDRDRSVSSTSVVSDAAAAAVAAEGQGHASASDNMQRRASSSGQQQQQHLDTPSLARRASGGSSMTRKEDLKREEKERKEREKAEKKERERREKEEQKEQKERMRAAQRTPSQTGRSRSGSHGHKERDSSVAPSAGGREKESAGGGMMDFMRIKVQRKTSVTSRKSDDARSEKSGHHHQHGDSQYGGSETKSRGGQSNASLNKKYGVCDKVIVGKGATAVVRLAHKWDRSTEKLYAVKVRRPPSSFFSRTETAKRHGSLTLNFPRAHPVQEFRKRRKNETEKEYVKKLTSEFCISSTLHQ